VPCGFETKLSAFATIFQNRLRTRMTQSWNFSPVAHIALNAKLAQPTRFERVTFAFGGQR
jgi:hypothetical protein